MNQKHPFNTEAFATPPLDYRPVTFWSWNETIQTDHIRTQLRQIQEAGLGGGFIHSRIGLLTKYLGEEWFDAVRVTIEESKKLGFKVFLYDEDKWPSGFAGGMVPLADEAYRMKALLARPSDKKVPDGYTPICSVYPGIQVYRWVSPLGYDWFNGTCYSDLMSREAMRCFIEKSYQSYYDRFAEHYGEAIILEFTDEPCTIFRGRLPEGAVPYSDDLPAAFQKLHGYDPRPHLYKLFINEDDALRFRIHYFRTVNDLFETNFSKQISDWCGRHNIGLTGHYMYETDMYGQQLWGTKVMANYRHQHQPGIDHLGRQIDEIISAKQCQSGVNQAGKTRMMSEMYGCSGQGVTFEDRLWIATQQIQLGVNFINPHLSLYTMSGCRKRDFPPNLFYQQPWWPINAAVDIPLSRLCYAMSQGTYAADTLVIHPQESTFALWQTRSQDCCDDLKADYLNWDTQPTEKGIQEKIEVLDTSFKELLLSLLEGQIHYDLGDETLIAEESSIMSADGKAIFQVGQMQYTTVIVPSMFTISRKTLDRLIEFQKIGGHIYRCGEGPSVLDGRQSDELEMFLQLLPQHTLASLAQRLNQENPVQVTPQTGRLRYLWTHRRSLKDGSMLMLLSNLTRSECFDGRVTIEGIYQGVWLLDHWTGQKTPVAIECAEGKTTVNLSLDPVQSRLLIFDATVSAQTGTSLRQIRETTEVLLESAEMKVRRLDDNALILDTVRWSTGDSALSGTAMPVVVLQELLNEEHYTGKLTLEYRYKVNGLSKSRSVKLVIEHPEYYRICVNGKACCYAGLEPWLDIRFMPIDISEMVVEGINTVRLECADFVYGDKTHVEDTIARYGTEIEAVYIVGDFSVQGQFSQPVFDDAYWKHWKLSPDLVALRAETAILTDPDPLVANQLAQSGLPFYAGKVEYTISLPEIPLRPDQRLSLSLEKLNAACAEVFVENGSLGYMVAHPYRIDITDVYQAGKEFRIVLYSTLRNLLGPHHHADGEMIFNSPLSFLPSIKHGQTYGQLVERWTDDNATPIDWQDNYCLIDFGNIGTVSLQRTP